MVRRLVILVGALSLLAAIPMAQAGAGPAANAAHVKRACALSHSSQRAGCFALIKTDAAGRVLTSPNAPPAGSISPAKFHSGYNLPNTTAGSANQTIAIVDAFSNPNVYADLKVYNNQFGLGKFPKCKTLVQKKCILALNQNGQKSPLPSGNVGWGLEIALDVQVAHAICQDCRIWLFEANSDTFANLSAAVNKAASMGANVISNSYGASGADCNVAGYNHPNIAVTVSSGDSGFGVSCPAIENTTVSVGGTTLNLTSGGAYVSESVWNGAGSGCSTLNSARAWQTAATNWAAIGCGTHRGSNDVSADANPTTGAAVYDTFGEPGWLKVGGTSLSAPLIGAVYGLAANASSFAYPAQSVYLSPGSLHDVTTGSNGSCGTHPLQCHGGAGFDLPTGIGTPNGLGGF